MTVPMSVEQRRRQCPSPGCAADARVAVAVNQPLTKLDCDRAGMAWNDGANVCGAAAEAMPEPQVAQPMPEVQRWRIA